MGHFVVGEGLVILHKGNTLEFLRRAGDTFWFEDVSDGALTSFTEEEFWEEWETMTLRVVDAVANKSELEFEDPNVATKKHRALNCLDGATQEDVDRMLSYIEGAIDAG